MALFLSPPASLEHPPDKGWFSGRGLAGGPKMVVVEQVESRPTSRSGIEEKPREPLRALPRLPSITGIVFSTTKRSRTSCGAWEPLSVLLGTWRAWLKPASPELARIETIHFEWCASWGFGV